MRLLLALGAAALLGLSGPRTLSFREYVGPTSVEGGAIAFSTYLSTPKQVCEHAVVWQPASGKLTYFRRPGQCRFYGDVNTVQNVYLAGRRLVWTDFTKAKKAPCVDMYTGTLDDPRAMPVAGAPCGGDAERSFDFAGRGNLLAFTSFSWCDDMDRQVCPASGGPYGRYRVALWRVAGTRAVLLTPLEDRTDLLAAGEGRIAVRRPDGAIDLYSASGSRLRTISYRSGRVVSAWLDGGWLIVRTRTGLDLRSAASGRLTRTLRLPAAARVGDVRGAFAAYVLRHAVHVLRLADGRDLAYRTIGKTFGEVFNASGAFYNSVPVGVVLDRSGLFYFYEAVSGPPGRIVFVPNAVLTKLLATRRLTGADAPKPGDQPSTARIALPGHSYHGNLAEQTRDKWGYYHALWKVRMKRLTQLTVRWSQPVKGPIQLNELPSQVTDRTWANQEPVQESITGANGRASFIVVAISNGWDYLVFNAPRPGPYAFSLSRLTPAQLSR